MDLHLDRASSIPIGRQLEAQIRWRIESGELAPTDRLPTARALAARLEVNANTVAAAYAALEGEGYLEANRRAGTRVAAAPPRSGPYLLAGRLSREFAERLEALGVAAEDALPLVLASRGATSLRVAVLAATPLEAEAAANRARAALGDEARCVPVTPDAYRSVDFHLTVIDPALVPALRGRPNVIPVPDPTWADGPEYPAGAD